MTERKEKQKERGPTIPKLFVCPITLEMMKEPTITSCGHMFEKEAIIGWIKGRDFKNANTLCPMCNQPINENQLAPCFPVKHAIEEFMATGKFFGEEKVNLSKQVQQSAIKNLARVKDGVSKLFRRPSSKGDLLDYTQNSNSSGPPVPPQSRRAQPSQPQPLPQGKWARLDSLSRNYESIEITKDNFVIGRNNACDFCVNRGEISGRHALFYRVSRAPNPGIDVFLQDLSTNGTFVNGKRLQKDAPCFIKTGDEISLGARFTSSEKPEVSSFIDWIFLGTLRNSPLYPDIEKARSITSFDELIEMTEENLGSFGIDSPEVRSKIIVATHNWKNEHQLPVYRFTFYDHQPGISQPTLIQNPSPNSENVAATRQLYEPASTSLVIQNTDPRFSVFQPIEENSTDGEALVDYRRSIAQSTSNYIPSTTSPFISTPSSASFSGFTQAQSSCNDTLFPEESLSEMNYEPISYEYGFYPNTYSISATLRQVVLTIKRNINIGESYVFISTTEDGTAVPQRDFNPIQDEAIFFPDRVDSVSYLFRWGIGNGLEGGWGAGDGAIQTINFILMQPNGNPALGFDDAVPNAVVIIEGSGIPQIPPSPSNQEDTSVILIEKMTNLFKDVSPATISVLIEKEKNLNSNSTYEEMEKHIMDKVIWYRDLPSEKDNLPPQVSYDQSSFKYKRDDEVAEEVDEGEKRKAGERKLTLTYKSPEPYKYSSSYELPPPPPETAVVPIAAFNLPPPPPAIVGWSSFSRAGIVNLLDLPHFVTLCCLDYIKNSANYRDFLNQNYIPHTTHRPSLLISTCKEIKNIVLSELKGEKNGKLDQNSVIEKVISCSDSVMNNLISDVEHDIEKIPRLTSGFEAFSCSVKSGMSSRSLIIEDFGSLYDLQNIPLTSLYSVIDGFGGSKAAELVTTYLCSHLASTLSAKQDFNSIISDSFVKTSDAILRKNEQEKARYGAVLSLLIIKGSDLYVAWLGGAQAWFLKAGKTSLQSKDLDLQPFPVTKKSPGSLESIGVNADEDTIDEWLANPDIISQFDPTKHAASPHISSLTLKGDEYYLVLGSKNFWKVLDENTVASLLTKFSFQQSAQSAADYLVSNAKRNNFKQAEDVSVLVFKFSNHFK